ncbi:hypothetical protein UVI_02051020 [Ustilaginoidea virens]|uniref:Fatty acid hydroxylase domain-containing protein n=1 Tax=Ustilaginoidea virens TaxID=1159556 RepID=A0A1B5L2D9_USTVR|nr:hypothetical protein UVI_02051020 [Ustilaginoidea virens]
MALDNIFTGNRLPTPLVSGISDFHLSLLAPVAVHWLTSALFVLCEKTGWLGKYRLHTSAEELMRNRVSKRECLRVTLQCQIQALQILLGLGLGALSSDDIATREPDHVAIWTGRLVAALVVSDFCMYCLHRLGHTNKWLYKHVHSQHHRLYVPYSWGGSYNHPFDSLVVDGLSYAIGCWASACSTRLSVLLFAYASFKNVTDHCGYVFPWNPILFVTGTDPSFHDVHHQSWGLKTNFGAHFSIWDRLMGTYFGDQVQILELRKRNRIAAEASAFRKPASEM